MHPILLPGTHVLRRDADTLQVGLDPAERVLLPDTPRHRRLVLEPPAGAQVATLGHVLLPDDAPLRAALPPVDSTEPEALWARHSLASRARLGLTQHQRPAPADVIVLVQAYGGRLGECLADDLRTLLRRAGLPAPAQRRPGPRQDPAPTEVHVVVGVGEPPRALLDYRVQSGTSHLVLRFVEGRAVLGPFVVPGRTGCLHCVDLHRTDADPAWPLLVEQYARLTRHDRSDGVPEPVDAALAAVATGWAVRDVAAHLQGTSPVTRSRTFTMTPDLVEVVLQEWPQRPDCGCVAR
jgi:bacteriocin biosynthesis cyclodehydratase domain-containing protein